MRLESVVLACILIHLDWYNGLDREIWNVVTVILYVLNIVNGSNGLIQKSSGNQSPKVCHSDGFVNSHDYMIVSVRTHTLNAKLLDSDA